MKTRMKFTKQGEMRFIGHLDLMRHFQKALRRSGLAVKYSEGMSPHIIMSFASPLGLGLTSEGEYVEVEFSETLASSVIIEALNACLTDEVRILSCKHIADGHATNGMSLVAGADYTVYLRSEYITLREGTGTQETAADICRHWTDRTEAFLAQPSITALKETKKGTKEIDIRPMIFEMKPTEDNGLFLRLSAGSAANLKPELLIEAYAAFLGIQVPEYGMAVHRIDMFAKGSNPGELVSLDDLGETVV